MIVPIYNQEEMVKEDRYPTDSFASFMRNLLQNLQIALGDEGFWVPSVTAANITVLEANFANPAAPVDPSSQTVSTGVQAGTLIFDPDELNGGAPGSPNGQLKVMLKDGTFHAIVNL